MRSSIENLGAIGACNVRVISVQPKAESKEDVSM